MTQGASLAFTAMACTLCACGPPARSDTSRPAARKGPDGNEPSRQVRRLSPSDRSLAPAVLGEINPNNLPYGYDEFPSQTERDLLRYSPPALRGDLRRHLRSEEGLVVAGSSTTTERDENCVEATPELPETGCRTRGRRQGLWTFYYPDLVQERMQATYLAGQIHGFCQTYFPDGQQESQSEYQHGKRHGAVVHYNPDGSIASRARYVDGQLRLCETFDAAGEVIKVEGPDAPGATAPQAPRRTTHSPAGRGRECTLPPQLAAAHYLLHAPYRAAQDPAALRAWATESPPVAETWAPADRGAAE